ncbi:MFS general substrate transporter [Polychaeton citri CBS 116435]|uniref:MFS general substrate transporter n=1 Tax=Polychaeton citri CBS 116435 TaxID=1314669 RepID=A0A9P4Q5S2_9PEZI|nr:MFS general substrate transporter [Polychaeton citri CBS 116435]
MSRDEESYPEGGSQAWLVVSGSFIGAFMSLGTVSSIGIFHAYLNEHQLEGYSESLVGWIFSIYIFLTFFCGVQVGPTFDTYGPTFLMLAGGICMSSSMLLLGVCTKYWHFALTFGILNGVGTSLVVTPAFAVIGHYFYKKRGIATGIAAAGGSLGGIVFPLMLKRLFANIGFVWATRIMRFLFIFCTIITIILVRSRLPPKPGQSAVPDLRILKYKAYILLTVSIYFMEWALFVPITYLATFATSTGLLSSAISFEFVAILNAGSCLGRCVSGYVADKFGRFNSMAAALALCAATTVTLWIPISALGPSSGNAENIKALVITYSLVFGLASGSNISLTPVCVGQLCDTNSYGRYYATCYTVVSFGTLTGIPIAGALIQAAGGGYWGVGVWTFICYVVSLGCCLWSRASQVGWKLGVKV